MTFRFALPLAALLALGACASYEKGEVADSGPGHIKIAVGYDAAVKGVDSRRQAAEFCAENDKRAIWYGHDRDGNLQFKCEET